MIRWMTIVGFVISAVACGKQSPSPPTSPTAPPAGPPAANQAPQITASITPASGVDQLTVFTARVEVSDADRDPVALTVWGACVFGKDTPVDLNEGVAVLSFKSDSKCSPHLVLTATDARGATTRSDVSAEHKGLGGPFRLVLGDGFYAQPAFAVNLTQSGTVVLGTIWDDGHHGRIDPAESGTIDEEGRFRLRFKIQSEPDDLVLTGQLIAPRGNLFTDNIVGVGQVVGQRYTGRAFQLWHEAQY